MTSDGAWSLETTMTVSWGFLNRSILPKRYPTHDRHIVYIGEVLAATKRP